MNFKKGKLWISLNYKETKENHSYFQMKNFYWREMCRKHELKVVQSVGTINEVFVVIGHWDAPKGC